jgi:uncharacterized protein YjaZ
LVCDLRNVAASSACGLRLVAKYLQKKQIKTTSGAGMTQLALDSQQM